MNPLIKVASAFITAGFVAGAVAIGGGTPLSPARIADATSEAADNSSEAERNTAAAAKDTRALVTIATNVASQLDTSRRMLDIQLRIEAASKDGSRLSGLLTRRIRGIGHVLATLEGDLQRLADLSARATSTTRASENAARILDATLEHLMERYRVVIRESRELNRKARGYREVRP